jgi:hypothetical protein
MTFEEHEKVSELWWRVSKRQCGLRGMILSSTMDTAHA